MCNSTSICNLAKHHCQGRAGPWYARRERVAVKAMGSVVQWFGDSDEGVSPNWTEDERKQWIAGNRQRQD